MSAARLAACAGVAAVLASLPLPAAAQAASRPAITVAPTIAATAASQSALPISVGPADAVPRNSFVRLRGLPPMAALTEGHSIAPGSWAVALAALPNLKLVLPPGVTGRADIRVTLVAVDGMVLSEARTTLVIAAAPAPGKAAAGRDAAPPASASILRAGVPPLAPPRAVQAPAPTPMTPHDRERAERLMKKGDEQIKEGNISAARLLYERAAEVGLAEAAMALAATFDEAELERLNVRGISANAVQARRWYERARQLGAPEADQRLSRLGAN